MTTKSAWPFKKCASPSAFLKALRASIPHRFKTWKTTWWLDRARDDLVFTIVAGPVAAHSHHNFALTIGDILSSDTYERRHAKSPRMRRFTGYAELHLSTGSSHEGCFRLPLKHLPLVQRANAARRRLQEECVTRWSDDRRLRDLRLKLDALHTAISDRIEQVRQEHHAANAALEARLEDIFDGERD